MERRGPGAQENRKAMSKTIAQLQAELEEMRGELKAAKEKARSRVSFKVTDKGGISLYGVGRFPVTLYISQWDTVSEEITSGRLAAFIEENRHRLTDKPKAS
jgi:hypothetical protein